jgi:maleate cis-trans isomerase
MSYLEQNGVNIKKFKCMKLTEYLLFTSVVYFIVLC